MTSPCASATSSPDSEHEERQVTEQVAAPEAPWLADESVHPLEARSAPQPRCLDDVFGHEVEGCPDSQDDCGVQRGESDDFVVLLRCTDADPDDVCRRFPDQRIDVVSIAVAELSEGGLKAPTTTASG